MQKLPKGRYTKEFREQAAKLVLEKVILQPFCGHRVY